METLAVRSTPRTVAGMVKSRRVLSNFNLALVQFLSAWTAGVIVVVVWLTDLPFVQVIAPWGRRFSCGFC